MISIDCEVYAVCESYDRDFKVIAHFTNKDDADKLQKTSAYYTVHARQLTQTIFESYDEYETWKNDGARRKALAKLTHAERKLLGLVE